jgi:hypothetical protein
MSEQEPPQGEEFPSVDYLLMMTADTFLTVGYGRLGLTDPPVEVDLGEARLAIEGLRALMPLLEEAIPPGAVTGLRQALSDLQLAYSRALEPPATAEAESPEEPEERPKIWTPRGDV